jgi:hypothetical protein
MHSWFALMKDKMYTVETRDDKRANWLFSLSVFTRLTAECMPVLFPYLIGMQVLPTFVVPYFAYITNHFFGLFGSPVLLVNISHKVQFSEKCIDKKCVV